MQLHTRAPHKGQPCAQRCRRHFSPRVRVIANGSPTTSTAVSSVGIKELKDAQAAVRLASKLCKVVQTQLDVSERTDKNDDSPVTVADYGAQVLVAWSLSQSSPGTTISMVAEEDSAQLRAPEGKQMLHRITDLVNSIIALDHPGVKLSPEDVIALIDLGASPGGPSGLHWVLDPIDGTRGFVGKRQYSVCLGLIHNGKVELGVLGCPNLPQGDIDEQTGAAGADSKTGDDVGCLFHALRGRGAYAEALWQSGTTPQRIHVDDLTDFASACFMESYESRHSNHSLTAQVAQQVGVVLPPLRMDSQVKYGLLSRGAASIFMRFPPPTYREKIWDHCAGFVIVEEAGGLVTDASGKRLDFSEGRYLSLDRGILAAPPRLHAALIQAVNKISPAPTAKL